MTKKKIFFNLQPKSDWLHHPQIRLCSLEARAVWIDMECLMFEATDKYGHLMLNGQPAAHHHLAVLTGTPADTIARCLAEMVQAGVAGENRHGVIYSRRLLELQSKSERARKNGKNGGNPSLRKDKEKSGSDNLQVKPEVDDPDKLRKMKSEIKEKNTKKRKNDADTPAPANDQWFCGEVIRLGREEYERLRDRAGMTDAAFWDALKGRDQFTHQRPYLAGKWRVALEDWVEKLATRGTQHHG